MVLEQYENRNLKIKKSMSGLHNTSFYNKNIANPTISKVPSDSLFKDKGAIDFRSPFKSNFTADNSSLRKTLHNIENSNKKNDFTGLPSIGKHSQ
jgi:hypothetical protein